MMTVTGRLPAFYWDATVGAIGLLLLGARSVNSVGWPTVHLAVNIDKLNTQSLYM